MPLERHYTPAQAALQMNMSVVVLRRWLCAGRIPATRTGGQWRIAESSLKKFLKPNNQ